MQAGRRRAMRHGNNRRRWSLAGVLAVTAAVVLAFPAAEQRASARIVAASVPVSIVTGSPSKTPTVSGNGRFVVYTAAPGANDGRTSSVWLDDRQTNTQVELTLPKDGVRLGDSVNPVISADGCVVVVTTEMGYDLFRDDDHGSRWDVYREILPVP